ncbi:hypothetical protein [Bradyrhizobium sp. 27S5]|uniref:hypothetical protein n=1 Tax=Bradyrhizobium sp. 27S5 TaxID=3139728 RepID=UPI0030D2475D
MPVGEYVSPDGQLKFIVTCPDGDWTIGFDGYPWHTHGSVLAALTGQDEVVAVERLLADLIGNVSVITLARRAGKLVDIWVTDDPAKDLSSCKEYGSAEDTVEFRLWNGTSVKI